MAGADYSRIHDPAMKEHFVYRLLGKRGRLLYVGCSMNLPQRIKDHRRNGRMGDLIHRVEIEGPFNYQDGRAREKELILQKPGAFNTEWTPKHRRGVPLHKLGWPS